MSVGFDPEDLESLRVRLRKMNDEQLFRFGEAARYMCSPKANLGHPPRDVFVTQLNEARAERRRRHPAKPGRDSMPRFFLSALSRPAQF